MTVYLYVGTPGSGKSYSALALALMQVRRRPIVANFPVRRQPDRWYYQDEFTVEELVRLSVANGWMGRESSALLILDEAGTLFNSRDWQVDRANRDLWLRFFSQHRKLGYDIILIAQHDRMIDRQIRAQVEIEVRFFSLKQWLWWLPFPWPVFLRSEGWYHTRLRRRVSVSVLIPWVANRYDHMRLFGAWTNAAAAVLGEEAEEVERRPPAEGGPAERGVPSPRPRSPGRRLIGSVRSILNRAKRVGPAGKTERSFGKICLENPSKVAGE